jgi:serine/threonine protein kinase
VSTQKIEELGYEKSINREIAILRTLSHPGIARLVSSFRFRDGAYLVLEYASGGDLHTLLKRNGSLDNESTKFVTGEIVAALWSIHEAGFVFGDMKPENILITESGHIKVTDFGGCRAVTPEASEALKASGQNILRELRDGDWRASKIRKSNGTESSNEIVTEGDEEDLRIEGTAAYLPPEVIVGGIPTPAADAWALGCVLYQCLSGRPPLLEDTDDLTKEKIVRFHMTEESEDDASHEEDTFFHGKASDFSEEAKALVHRLLARDAHDRPSMMSVSQSSFFEGTNVFALHKGPAYPLDVGSVAPVADAKWQRRQYSSIWAPQPEAYVIGGAATNMTPTNTLSSQDRRAPILEGDEATLPFLPRHANRTTTDSSLTKIRE